MIWRGFLWMLLTLAMLTPAGAAQQISEQTYKRLARVHELMDQERYAQAQQQLEKIRPAKQRPYEKALVLQTMGYLYTAQERHAEAIEALRQCLELNALPKAASQSSRYTLAQLQQIAGDHNAAAASLERWFKLEQAPSAQAHAFAGGIHTQGERYEFAAKHLRKAIALSETANEAWYRQLLGVYYAMEDERAAAGLLEKMIVLFPHEKAYWLRLSHLYHSLKDDTRSLALLELAWQQGFLSEPQELLGLFSAYLSAGVPHKAARLLEASLRNGVLASKAEHWRLLGEGWLQAREMDKALGVMRSTASMSRQPNDYLRLAELAAQMHAWKEVLQAVAQVQSADNPQRPGRARLLEAIAHYHLGDLEAAKATFGAAGKHLALRQEAQVWLDFLASENHF
jgi:tetratricopeptide (TPR) repeat protein